MTNNFVGIGRVTANAELKYTNSGTACLKFSICINKSYKKDGEWQSKPNFFNCIVWGKYGETMHKHILKGRLISVVCELEQNSWEDNSGNKHNGVNFNVSNIEILDRPKSGNRDDETTRNDGKGTADTPPDEVPF